MGVVMPDGQYENCNSCGELVKLDRLTSAPCPDGQWGGRTVDVCGFCLLPNTSREERNARRVHNNCPTVGERVVRNEDLFVDRHEKLTDPKLRAMMVEYVAITRDLRDDLFFRSGKLYHELMDLLEKA